MIMDVTKNVILDLLPLYLADEVSPDTRALVEEYFETDPELRDLAERVKNSMSLPGNIPVPLTEEDELKSYRKSKWLMILTIGAASLLVMAILGATLLVFLLGA